jgi:hypothetical protein
MSALSESPPVVDANGCEVVSGPIENRIVEPHEVHPGLPNGTRVRHPSGKLVPLGERFQTRDPVEVGRKGGRPKGLARRIREMVGDDPGRIANILFDILEDPTARDNDRIAAAKELFDRGWGKAPTFMPIEGGDPLEQSELDQAIRSIADQLVARRVSPAIDAALHRREIEEGVRES